MLWGLSAMTTAGNPIVCLLGFVGNHGVETKHEMLQNREEEDVRPFDICTLRSTVSNIDGLDIFCKWRSKGLMTETRQIKRSCRRDTYMGVSVKGGTPKTPQNDHF